MGYAGKINFGLILAVFLAAGVGHAEEGKMIENGSHVKMNYTLKVEGQVADTTEGREPFEVVAGAEGLIAGFQENIQGLKAGDKKSFTVAPEQGYGFTNPEAVVQIERSKLPEGEIKEGMIFTAEGEGGYPLRGVVKGIEGENVTLDFNHPLAGKTLDFEVEILEVG